MLHCKTTVVLCTHNPRKDYLGRTLASLQAQSCPRDQWDLLLVDNASITPVQSLCDLAWHPNARVVQEKALGLTNARMRAIRETRSKWTLFVDDDNELDSEYLSSLLNIIESNPRLGCIGAGRIVPEYQEAPDLELFPYTPMLALREVDRPQWSNAPNDKIIPWGAGLAVRREVAEAFCSVIESCPLRQQLGRKGTDLASSEDDEFSKIACELGFGKGIFPELRITHLISNHRVQVEYLLRLAEGMSYSHALLAWIHSGRMPKGFNTPRLGDVFLPWDKFREVLKVADDATTGRGGIGRLRIWLGVFFLELFGRVYSNFDSYWRERNLSAIQKKFLSSRREGLRRASKMITSVKSTSMD